MEKIGFIKQKYITGPKNIDEKKEKKGEEHVCPRVREEKGKREKFILLWGRIP